MNDLRNFFNNRKEGRGIWKWDHYFDIYEKHFSKFRNKLVNVLEIGIYSGGSLDMWKDYFGKDCRVYGVDIQKECEIYSEDQVEIWIGDQSDPKFWEEFKFHTPKMDIIIDDGSHKPRHQLITFNSLFPHLNPGGVYLCEDIHGYPESHFANNVYSFAEELNDHRGFTKDRNDNDRRLVKVPTQWQRDVNGIHLYPYVAVIERNNEPVKEFIAPKRGTEWAPFKP